MLLTELGATKGKGFWEAFWLRTTEDNGSEIMHIEIVWRETSNEVCSSIHGVDKSVFGLKNLCSTVQHGVQTAPEHEDLIYEVKTEIASPLPEHTDDTWALH